MNGFRLSAAQYLRPGAYIGFVFQARPVATSGLPRFPGFVARGSRLARTQDFGIVRSFVREHELTFTTVAPHVAVLQDPAINDKTGAVKLYTTLGPSLDSRYWRFAESVPGSGVYDLVEIEITKFDRNADYLIDYQSSSRTRQDELGIPEIREILYVGDSQGSALYQEGVDFRVVTEVIGDSGVGDEEALIRGASNSGSTGGVFPAPPTKTGPGGSTGTVVFNVANTYDYKYSLHYSLQCIATTLVPPETATFRLTITPIGGGNDLDIPVPPHPNSNWVHDFTITNNGSSNINYQLDGNYPFTDGIRLDFNFGAGPVFYNGNVAPLLADVFTWDAIAAQRIEIASPFFNTNQFSTVTEPEDYGNNPSSSANTSSGKISLNVDTNYSGVYNRKYYFEVLSVVAGPPRQATILWGAWGEDWTIGTINIDESNTNSLTRVSVEKGIYVDFDFGVEHLLPDPGDTLVSGPATDLTTALALATEIRTNYNQHDADSLVAAHLIAPLHPISTAAPVDLATLVLFCQDAETTYTAHINDATQHTNIDSVYTLDSTIDPTDLASCVNFLNDFKAKFNRHILGVNFIAGDSWLSVADGPLMAYTAKDDRHYYFTTTTVNPGTQVSFQWRTDTWEGGWDNVDVLTADPYIQLPDGIILVLRSWDPLGNVVQYTTADEFEFTAINMDLIDWTLAIRTTESIPESNIRQDPFGRVTFVPLSYYLTLSETPSRVISVKDAETGTPLSYVWVHDSNGEPLPVIMFVTDPATNVEVYYEYDGLEPTPGNTYYVTANRLRLLSEYEVPVFYATRDDANRGLRPVEVTNDAWIMTDIAFDTDFFGCYVMQVRSSTEDEVFSDADYRRGVDSSEDQKAITDLIVLNRFTMLGYSKLSVERMSSPFVGAERLLWQGAPTGTPIGDADSPGSLVYTAKTSLQFFGTGPGRGRTILLANTWANRQIILEDTTPTTVQLNGSFIAGYSAARQAAFDTPVETLLRKDTASFSDMQVYGEKELDILGSASILFFYKVGDGLFRFGESHTVDTGSPDVNEISAMTQKDYVTRRVRTKLDQNLVGLVPPSPAAGVVQIQSYLVEELGNIASEGFIAPYGSENNPPTTREINPDADTFVYVDDTDRRRYHLGYWFNILYPIKWIMGLYSVDSRFWDNRNNQSAQ